MVSKDHEEISVTAPGADLWTSFDRIIGPHFNLSIDLKCLYRMWSLCIACHAENNVPVVGKEEVRRVVICTGFVLIDIILVKILLKVI